VLERADASVVERADSKVGALPTRKPSLCASAIDVRTLLNDRAPLRWIDAQSEHQRRAAI
jgi:hypothetical protein